MWALLLGLCIIIIFIYYIWFKKLQSYKKSLVVLNNIIEISDKTQYIYLNIIDSNKTLIKTTDATLANTIATDIIKSYNKLSMFSYYINNNLNDLNQIHIKEAIIYKEKIDKAITDITPIIFDSIYYVQALPNTFYKMSRCPVPCYADNNIY